MIKSSRLNSVNESRRRGPRRQKIRNLRDSGDTDSPSRSNSNSARSTPIHAAPVKLAAILDKPKRFGGHAKLVVLLIVSASLLGFFYMGGAFKSQMLSVFIAKYTSQYMSIMHNKINYCDRDVKLNDMFGKIHQGVLHQEVALRKLEVAMQNRTNMRAIALVGSSGVGKSLTARLLREHFPWRENVHFFQWNTHIRENKQKQRRVQNMLKHLSRCGRNLLIIDNMPPCDHKFVAIINSAAMNMHTPKLNGDVDTEPIDDKAKQKQKRAEMLNNIDLTIMYIFNMNRLLSADLYDAQYAQLQELPNTTVIDYRSFGRTELAECIRHELKGEEMVMEEADIVDILRSTAVAESGCKLVRGKVIVIGKQKRPQSAAQIP